MAELLIKWGLLCVIDKDKVLQVAFMYAYFNESDLHNIKCTHIIYM